MNKARGLLAWISGGLIMAGVAAAIMVSSGRPVTPSLPQAGAVTAPVSSPVSLPPPTPAAEAPPAAHVASAVEAAAMPDASAPLPTAQAQSTAEPAVQSGQIWECTTNGQKTFSNNPCGEKSTLLKMRAINTMNPTPEVRDARAYGREPRYAPQYTDQNANADQNAYGDQNAYAGQDTYAAEPGNGEYGGSSYAIVQGLAFLPRRRPEHPHRPESHHNSGESHHNSGAMPRRN
jgi:hypothetical protein